MFLYSFFKCYFDQLLSTNQKFCKWFYCYNLRSQGSKKSVPFLKMKVVLLMDNIGSLLISPFLMSLCRNCLGFESYILMLCSKNPKLLSIIVTVMSSIFLFTTLLGFIHHFLLSRYFKKINVIEFLLEIFRSLFSLAFCI